MLSAFWHFSETQKSQKISNPFQVYRMFMSMSSFQWLFLWVSFFFPWPVLVFIWRIAWGDYFNLFIYLFFKPTIVFFPSSPSVPSPYLPFPPLPYTPPPSPFLRRIGKTFHRSQKSMARQVEAEPSSCPWHQDWQDTPTRE